MKIVPDFGNQTFSFFWKARNTHTHTHTHAHLFLYLFIYYKQWIYLIISIPVQHSSIYSSCHLFIFTVPTETNLASLLSINLHICSITGLRVISELFVHTIVKIVPTKYSWISGFWKFYIGIQLIYNVALASGVQEWISYKCTLRGHYLLSRVRLCVTPWTVAHQAPLSMGFSRQWYWSELPFPSLMHIHICVLF